MRTSGTPPTCSTPIAGVRCAAEQRGELEHLCRYITRPAIASERLSVNRAGQVVLKLKTVFRDGTTHLMMSPLEFMQRLAALVPRPRLLLYCFHGVLAPHAKLRAAIALVAAQHAKGIRPCLLPRPSFFETQPGLGLECWNPAQCSGDPHLP